MNTVSMLIIAAVAATAIVLVLGLRSMGRGGQYDKEHAEKFMWERVGLQALVIVLLVVAYYLLEA